MSQSISPPPARSLTGNAIWLLLAKIIGFVLNAALPIMLVRKFSQHDYGVYKQIFLIVGTSGIMMPLGVGMSLFYFLPREPLRRLETIAHVVLFYLLASTTGTLILINWPGALARLGAADLPPHALQLGLVVVLWTVGSLLDIVPIALGEARQASIFIGGLQTIRVTMMVSAVLYAPRISSLLYAAVAQGILQVSVLVWYLEKQFPGFSRRIDFRLWGNQLKYALPMGISGILYTLQLDVHNYMVSALYGPASLAVYSVGVLQLPLIGMLQDSTTAVLIPPISELESRRHYEEIIALLARSMRKLAFVYFPIYVWMFVLGREFITLLFTERYVAALPVLRVNLTMLPFSILVQDPLARAFAGERYFLLVQRAVSFLILIAALYGAAQIGGLVAAITATIMVTILDRAFSLTRFGLILGAGWRHLPLVRDVGKLMIAAVGSGLAVVLVRLALLPAKPLLVLAVAGSAGLLVYAALVWLLRVLDDSERQTVYRMTLGRLR